MPHILTIEDDPQTAEAIGAELSSHGYQVTIIDDGQQGLEAALAGNFDAITLDRMLPGLDGLGVVGGLRRAGLQTPILMISALSAVDERIRGLRAGGDDYLVKPFDLGELSARIDVLLRRSASAAPGLQLSIDDLELDLLRRTATRGGILLPLVPKEFALLEYMMRNAGQVLTKRMILETVWNCHFDPSTNLIEVHIARLRKKVDLPGMRPLIQTVRGSGYRLDPGG